MINYNLPSISSDIQLSGVPPSWSVPDSAFKPSIWDKLGSLGSSFLSGGGASGLLGGVASGLLGYFSQKSANEAMLEQTRMTNEHNYKMWQEQQAHNIDMFNMENQANIDMWNMQNEYNDPSAQVERLRAAGLNPSMMMGNNPSGTASSSPATASAKPADAPSMQAPPPQAFTPPGLQGLQQGLQAMLGLQQSFAQSKLLPLQKEGLKLDNYNKTSAYETMQFDLETKEMLSETTYLQQRMILQNLNAQNALLNLDFEYKTMFNSYFSEQQINDIALQLADLHLKEVEATNIEAKTETEKANKDAILQGIEESKQRMAESMARIMLMAKQGQQIDQSMRFADEMQPYLVAGQKQSNLGQLYNNEQTKLSYYINKKVFPSMVSSMIAGNEYNSIFYKNNKIMEDYLNTNLAPGQSGWNGFNSWFSRQFVGFGHMLNRFTPINNISVSAGRGR